MVRDINGYNGFGLQFSTELYSGILTSASEQTLTVPSAPDATYPHLLAIFSFAPGSSIWVARNQTAEVPTGAISSSTSEQNPAARYVYPGDVLHFITNDASDEYGVIFYSVP